jgi:multicomponent Na+:H+ antiporter subunit E
VLLFLGYFVGQLVLANLVVAREVVTPGMGICPAVVDYPTRSANRRELVLLSLIINLTPGTLTLAVEEDPPMLFVHGMHAADATAFAGKLAEMERRLLLAVRPVGARPGGSDAVTDPAPGDWR